MTSSQNIIRRKTEQIHIRFPFSQQKIQPNLEKIEDRKSMIRSLAAKSLKKKVFLGNMTPATCPPLCFLHKDSFEGSTKSPPLHGIPYTVPSITRNILSSDSWIDILWVVLYPAGCVFIFSLGLQWAVQHVTSCGSSCRLNLCQLLPKLLHVHRALCRNDPKIQVLTGMQSENG